jgi:hypothetical protein
LDGSSTNLLDITGTPLGTLLKQTVLTNIEGTSVQLGKYIGSAKDDATIIVFLRHLA